MLITSKLNGLIKAMAILIPVLFLWAWAQLGGSALCGPGWGCSHQGLDGAGTPKTTACVAVALVLALIWELSSGYHLGSPPCGLSVRCGLLRGRWLHAQKSCLRSGTWKPPGVSGPGLGILSTTPMPHSVGQSPL